MTTYYMCHAEGACSLQSSTKSHIAMCNRIPSIAPVLNNKGPVSDKRSHWAPLIRTCARNDGNGSREAVNTK